ncbi:MAG: MBOAT family protein [Steroidobacteraceae bacterium]
MLFNTPIFVVFFTLVCTFYWLLRERRQQNLLLLATSYVFYGMWSWKFLLLLAVSTAIDYWCAMRIESSARQQQKRFWLLLSLISNLGVLITFKYLGFFLQETVAIFETLGFRVGSVPVFEVLLPVGISFYTFQSMGYVVDVYRRKIAATHDLHEYALYVAFFPQLVAGPIERAGHMLPQFRHDRQWNVAAFESGLLLMAWGLFKKVVIADNLAPYVDLVFLQPDVYSGSTVLAAVVFFAFQIYCDFSGYTDIARGVARTMGFELVRNFDYPYISRTPVEFWRRWHISLSQWFQDYLYFPMAMRYMRLGGWASKYKAHIVAMGLIGFWHGANWTFIMFGLYWGLIIALYLYAVESMNERRLIGKWRLPAPLRILLTTSAMFALVCIGWILFRAESLPAAWQIMMRIFSWTAGKAVLRPNIMDASVLWVMIAGLLLVEWGHRRSYPLRHWIAKSAGVGYVLRAGLLAVILCSYLSAQQGVTLPFIYFQF